MYPAATETQYRGVLLFIHGFGDYAARQAHVGQEFSKMGYDFWIMDCRGMGSSGGQSMFVPSLEIMVDDLRGYWKLVMQQYTKK